MPRVDLITAPEFIDAVYAPLTQAHTSAYAIKGMKPIAVPHRLRSLASPWLIGAIVRPTDEVATRDLFTTYANRWHELVNEPPLVFTCTGVIGNHANYFNGITFFATRLSKFKIDEDKFIPS